MKISFLYSKNKEKEKLLDMYDKYEWFVDNNFPINLSKFYPRLYQKHKSNKKLFNKDLGANFDKSYDRDDYSLKIEKVRSGWQKIEKKFFNIINNLNLKIADKYLCYISLYGPEGQFNYPNIIDLRIKNNKDIKNANETIAHELIHLLIYNKTKKLKLNYRQTEGVVDLFFTETELRTIFPNYKLQNIGIHNKKLVSELIEIIK